VSNRGGHELGWYEIGPFELDTTVTYMRCSSMFRMRICGRIAFYREVVPPVVGVVLFIAWLTSPASLGISIAL